MLGKGFKEVECPPGKNHSGQEVQWVNDWSGGGLAGDDKSGERTSKWAVMARKMISEKMEARMEVWGQVGLWMEASWTEIGGGSVENRWRMGGGRTERKHVRTRRNSKFFVCTCLVWVLQPHCGCATGALTSHSHIKVLPLLFLSTLAHCPQSGRILKHW